MAKQLPKTIYVVWDQQPNDENSYLLAAEKWQEHADMTSRKVVGTYQLVETNEVHAPPVIFSKKKGRTRA